MKTTAFALILATAFVASTAHAQKLTCQDQVLLKLETDAAEWENWAVEGLSVMSREAAIKSIAETHWDLATEEKKEQAIAEAKKSGREFYSLYWSAPSNEGSAVIVVDEKTCEIVTEVTTSSEE